MKATGIVRRVDDLGRIVIPKEIRRTLRIREGDPLPKTVAIHASVGYNQSSKASSPSNDRKITKY